MCVTEKINRPKGDCCCVGPYPSLAFPDLQVRNPASRAGTYIVLPPVLFIFVFFFSFHLSRESWLAGAGGHVIYLSIFSGVQRLHLPGVPISGKTLTTYLAPVLCICTMHHAPCAMRHAQALSPTTVCRLGVRVVTGGVCYTVSNQYVYTRRTSLSLVNNGAGLEQRERRGAAEAWHGYSVASCVQYG